MALIQESYGIPAHQSIFSVGGSNDCDQVEYSFNPYLAGRRPRRMTLLESLRYQNKQLADSGFELLPEEKNSKGTCEENFV